MAKRHKVDPRRVFLLAWSSGGPAAYSAALASDKITGAFVAMSVFKPDLLPPLKRGEGKAFYLYHSADDRVCPCRMAKQAAEELAESGATVTLRDYDGGHGWRGNVFADIDAGLRWLVRTAVE